MAEYVDIVLLYKQQLALTQVVFDMDDDDKQKELLEGLICFLDSELDRLDPRDFHFDMMLAESGLKIKESKNEQDENTDKSKRTDNGGVAE